MWDRLPTLMATLFWPMGQRAIRVVTGNLFV